MAFGQAAGPSAGTRRVAELAELLAEQGYDSFKEARHPFGLTQRQANGKFTVAEADELIALLESTAGDEEAPVPSPVAARPSSSTTDRARRRDEELVARMDAEVLATELVNRGWCCIAPPD